VSANDIANLEASSSVSKELGGSSLSTRASNLERDACGASSDVSLGSESPSVRNQGVHSSSPIFIARECRQKRVLETCRVFTGRRGYVGHYSLTCTLQLELGRMYHPKYLASRNWASMWTTDSANSDNSLYRGHP
jgi:hypothetical protein